MKGIFILCSPTDFISCEIFPVTVHFHPSAPQPSTPSKSNIKTFFKDLGLLSVVHVFLSDPGIFISMLFFP